MRSAALPPMLVTGETSGSVDGSRPIHGYMTEERAKARPWSFHHACSLVTPGHPRSPIADDSNGDSNSSNQRLATATVDSA